VNFETNWQGCYKANLWSRVASRIVKPLLDFPAYEPNDLYFNIKKHDFTKYIPPNGTLEVVSQVRDCMIRDQRFVALKVKDAIVDQFRDQFGIRPDVDTDNPDMKIIINGHKNNFSVALDTSGDGLHRRGYRVQGALAPIKENLAAGLLSLSGWKPGQKLYDPFCGSGTFLIEAALWQNNTAPGLLRKKFGFQRLSNYKPELWDELVEEALSLEGKSEEIGIFGTDSQSQVIQIAKQNARSAGVDHLINFARKEVSLIEPPAPTGLIVTNPPYGERLGNVDMLKDLYRDLGFALKARFKGWEAYILAGSGDLTPELKMKAQKKFVVFNGPIECRFLNYPISVLR
jgi:23S rRNA G2445 N2-methylase RlmL